MPVTKVLPHERDALSLPRRLLRSQVTSYSIRRLAVMLTTTQMMRLIPLRIHCFSLVKTGESKDLLKCIC